MQVYELFLETEVYAGSPMIEALDIEDEQFVDRFQKFLMGDQMA